MILEHKNFDEAQKLIESFPENKAIIASAFLREIGQVLLGVKEEHNFTAEETVTIAKVFALGMEDIVVAMEQAGLFDKQEEGE